MGGSELRCVSDHPWVSQVDEVVTEQARPCTAQRDAAYTARNTTRPEGTPVNPQTQRKLARSRHYSAMYGCPCERPGDGMGRSPRKAWIGLLAEAVVNRQVQHSRGSQTSTSYMEICL
ncbi:unnamed protein product [Pleuronectes platessa]|uniref:Uncharacterized protein n=1 Tax=Pleuronectes platessa TaxID=8262 RepID=A0A9N7YG52_PLEPL|nr:unnamed protein product [Pleuronectes platessa]